MTTFNGRRFLQAQLDSLAAQVHLPGELVVCDDGSTDGSLGVLEGFAARAPFPVRIVRNTGRLGYRANFLKAAGLCTQPVIAFCDQDDIWHPDKLARMARHFAADDDILLVYHNAMLVTEHGEALRPFYDAPASPPLARRLTLPPWHLGYGYSLSFRRVLLAASRFWPRLRDAYHAGQPMGHDLFFFMLAATLGSVAYDHECLVQYRQHAAQTIGTFGREAPGWLQKWRYRLEDRRGTYRHLAQVAAGNAAMFQELGEHALHALPVVRAAEGAAAWRLLTDLYRLRADVAGGPTLRRVQAWRRLRALGAYGEGYWTFGRHALVKDALLGVVLAPVIGRIGLVASQGDPGCRRGASYQPI